jgi:uncharacterized protein with FMN-binding domain
LEALEFSQIETQQGAPVKKALFSLAFVAASGVYVAAANHLLPLGDNDGAVTVKQTAAPVDISPIAPAASATPLLASSQPASGEPAPIIAEVAPAPTRAPAPPVLVRHAPAVAQAAPSPMPPLPRPRPTPSDAAVQQAASTDVAASAGSGYRDGTYTGSSENAYYGRVQVQVTVANHQVAGIKVLSYPSDRRTSRYINSQALPLLQQEVITANSANVDTISGATLTSEAYIRSLGTALRQAGTAGA